ncbi:hypothetical protein C8R45DRAFT_393436 [Mycena sanguinolenta]|nr:hypothetical protein C8R45DRAFT_393436 [Mycena sanguinolenta]
MLSTLNPLYLKTEDYTVLSDSRPQKQLAICFIRGKPAYGIDYFRKGTVYQPFPPRTAGFFYYHAPKDFPPMAGGLRFRITASENPASFQDGHDLLHEGLPWQVSLSTIAIAVGSRTVLRERLLHEGLVTQADLDKCCAVMQGKRRLDPNRTLYRLAQPFAIHFHRKLSAWVVGESKTKLWARDIFAEHRARYTVELRGLAHSCLWPYTGEFCSSCCGQVLIDPSVGSALAQFELSTFPEHAGSDTIVMRIVKMLVPPTCVVPHYDNNIPAPVEGELVRRPMGHARASRVQPWFCDLAAEPSGSAVALRMLVENTRRWPAEYASAPCTPVHS